MVKKTSEIDDIFSNLKSGTLEKPKKLQNDTEKTTKNPEKISSIDNKSLSSVVDASGSGNNPLEKSMPKQKQLTVNDCEDGFADSRGTHHKMVDDMKVFYNDDLRIGEGDGDTPLCPFDCDCCF
ncbi:hypothetical protein BB559_003443 [Furculomyces boomerangus]|uniref:DUF1764 domain-containing protein n=1 Tax=Furculomyces boomerangus TaxID=61424 RepID=A0A2T9YL84_9FUNG|nr:hypothetical protein BB559_003443 [Furculomyces boomerangus]